jgi:hypothetical protein
MNLNQFLNKVGRRSSHDLFSNWYFLILHALGHLKPVTVFFLRGHLGQLVPQHDLAYMCREYFRLRVKSSLDFYRKKWHKLLRDFFQNFQHGNMHSSRTKAKLPRSHNNFLSQMTTKHKKTLKTIIDNYWQEANLHYHENNSWYFRC